MKFRRCLVFGRQFHLQYANRLLILPTLVDRPDVLKQKKSKEGEKDEGQPQKVNAKEKKHVSKDDQNRAAK